MSIHTRGDDPHEPLEAVLRAATVPWHPDELAGEHAAVAAFRAAADATPHRRPLLRRVLTVKALVVGAVATSAAVVLTTAGAVLPGLRPEPVPPTVPVSPPSVSEASVPTGSPSAGLQTVPTTPPAGKTTPNPPDGPGKGAEHDNQDDPDRRGKGKDGKQNPLPSTENSDPADDDPTESSSHTQTPDTSAHGAVTAVPPSGAEPPSPGG
jgi:hypothetical protein